MRIHIPIFLCALLCTPSVPAEAPSDAAELNARINVAIEKGKKALLARLDGVLKDQASDFPGGRIAIVLTALLKSGVPANDPEVEAAFATLETMKITKTYCAACYLFALDGLSRAEGGKLEESQRKKMAELVQWLVDARTKGHGSWTYETSQKPGHHDFSNTQFAILGLRVGLEHGISVPREVFEETAKLFVGAVTREAVESDVEITLVTPIEAKLKLTRVSPERRLRAAPGGWGYSDPRRSKGKGKLDEPYASMTAAGASSLAIALHAIASGKNASTVDPKLLAEGEKTLHSAYGWIAKHFDLYVADGRQIFYALYSLEKAGDVCGVEKFGGHDWYLEGATRILERQKPNGGWGTYVDTSLALLFLTRATRSLVAASAPMILTGGAGSKPPGSTADGDLVYIERLKGFLSARELLKYMGETRSPELATVGEEIVRHYAPDSRENLVTHLIDIWSKPDKITAFAQKALAEVTGLKSPRREAYVEWLAQLESVRRLETKVDLTPGELAAKLREVASPRLKARLAGLAQRRAFVDLAGALIEELSTPSAEYRRKLHGILSLWLGDAVKPPSGDAEPAWEATAKSWQEWWRTHGAEWEAGRKK